MAENDIFNVFSINKILCYASEENIQKYITENDVKLCKYAAGETVYSPTWAEKCVGIIIDGKANATTDNTLLKVMEANDIFGIANLYSDDVFPSTITAKTSVTVMYLEEYAFKALLENDPSLLVVYLGFLSNKIVYLNKKIYSLTAKSSEKKLAAFLINNEQNGCYNMPMSTSALADMLSVGRASLYRAIDTLTEQNLIEKNGKTIIIKDKKALLQFV